MDTSELKSKLFYSKKSVYERRGDETASAAYDYAEHYKRFLDAAKTEREAVSEAIKMAESAGFRPFRLGDKISVGDRLYYNNHGKNLFLINVGSEPLERGIRIAAAHIDSPRLDLKQCPLYEEGGMSFFKTHYYGGIRKYQWVATPLALHGSVVRADGSVADVVIGEEESDPLFYITDLLPHLGAEHSKKPLGEAFPGEKLNVLVGSRPCGEGSDAIKLNVMRLLNEKYGIDEEDFLSAELSLVPAAKARDVGLDRALVGAYGHDDRVCAYPALTAILANAGSEHNLLCVLADKEETGSNGVTGMKCSLMIDIIDSLCRARGSDPAVVRAASRCLSADVSAAYDPLYPEVFEQRNTPLLNCGVVLTKYTGSRGKNDTNDASAEYIGHLRSVMRQSGVIWQAGELGKVDAGGGGTVAKYIANHNIETVDLGVPVLSMHSPYEIIAKADLYEASLAFSAFFRS